MSESAGTPRASGAPAPRSSQSAGAPAAAAEPDLVFPAGVACTFSLGITVGNGGPQHLQEFTDAEGTVVGSVLAGRGTALTYTNMDTGATFASRANGSVWRTTYHVDGSSTVRMMGHSLVVMFPTDVPAGPSTTLYTGQVVAHWAADGATSIVQESGRSLDVCAELAG